MLEFGFFDILFYVCGLALILILIFMVGWVAYMIGKWLYRKTLRYETYPDKAVVCGKKYEKPYTSISMMPAGKVMVPRTIHHEEEFNVYLEYEGKKHCFDYEDLYNEIKIGDTLDVFVEKGYNKFGKVKHVSLSIEM